MNRRERITAVFKGEEPDRTPMGFWMHFPTEQHHGEEALAAHLKYFEEGDLARGIGFTSDGSAKNL